MSDELNLPHKEFEIAFNTIISTKEEFDYYKKIIANL